MALESDCLGSAHAFAMHCVTVGKLLDLRGPLFLFSEVEVMTVS